MSELSYERINFEDSPSTNTPINATNLNKMDKGIADCTAKVNECFQSASEGKTLIASALTGKGQTSTSADTYAQMASKINNLMAVPTATKSITANGSNIDVTNYGKVNVNVSSTNFYTTGSFSISTATAPTSTSVNLGWQPSRVMAYFVGLGRASGWIDSGIGFRWTSSTGGSYGINGTYSDAPLSMSLTSSGFTVSITANDCTGTWYYIALK